MIRVFLANDKIQSRTNLRSHLLSNEKIKVVGEAGSILDSLKLIEETIPDILVLNLSISNNKGIELVQLIRKKLNPVRILALSERDTKEEAKIAINAGCQGYMPARSQLQHLVEGIFQIDNGKRHIKIEKRKGLRVRAQFVVYEKGHTPRVFNLFSAPLVVGRTSDAQLMLPNVSVSRRHAILDVDGEGWHITDLQSKNGLLLNGEVVDKVNLQSGDQLQIGKYLLVYTTDDLPKQMESHGWLSLPSQTSELPTARVAPRQMEQMRDEVDRMRWGCIRVGTTRDYLHLKKDSLMFGGKDGISVKGVLSLGYSAMINWVTHAHILRKTSILISLEVNGKTTKEHALQVNDKFRIGKSHFSYELLPKRDE